MSSQSPCALRVSSSREALRNYDLPPGGATLNPCRFAALAALLGAQAPPPVELSPSPSSFWAWSAFLAGVVLAFVVGWWLGRMALGNKQARALTHARFNVERSRVLAHELQDRCVTARPDIELESPPAIASLELFKGRMYDDAGEIVRQTASAGDWLGDVRWPRPLGMSAYPAPQKIFPFAPANKKRGHGHA